MNRHGSGLNSHSPSLIISIEHTIKKNKTLLFVGFFITPPGGESPISTPFFWISVDGGSCRKKYLRRKKEKSDLKIFKKMEGIWDYIVVIYWIVMGCSLMMVGVVGLD